MRCDAKEREKTRIYLENDLDVDTLIENRPSDAETIRGIVELVADAMCSCREKIRIGREEIPQKTVRERFLKLRAEHIEYVLDGLRRTKTDVKDAKAYMLTSLYNAVSTFSGWADTQMHERYGGTGT